MATLGKKLALVLADRGWSASELARRVGVSAATASRWVNDQREPSLSEGRRAALALGVSLAWLSDPEADFPPSGARHAAGIDRETTAGLIVEGSGDAAPRRHKRA